MAEGVIKVVFLNQIREACYVRIIRSPKESTGYVVVCSPSIYKPNPTRCSGCSPIPIAAKRCNMLLPAFTAKDRKAIKLTAENYPIQNYMTQEVLTSAGIGEP